MKLEPNGLFFWVYVIIYYIPSLYTLSNREELNLDSEVAINYFFANTLFLLTVYFMFFFLNFKSAKSLKIKLFSNQKYCLQLDESAKSIIKNFKIGLIPFNLLMLIFFLFESLPKILLLGTNLTPEEFRFIGYDDRSLALTFILEISRRGIYPLVFLFLLLFYYRNRMKKDIFFYYTQITFFLVSSTNIDRGPIALIFFIYIYYFLVVKENGFLKKAIIFILLLTGLSVSLAVMTFLQYNILDFDFASIKDLSILIILKRIILDPSLAAYKYSFEIIRESNDFLYLKYSRLFSLFTGNYVNSQSDISIYVSPVGIVGDLWRNFGFIGIFIFGMIVTFSINVVNNKIKNISYYKGHIINLILIMFTATLIFGGLFSYQPIFLFCLMLLILGYKKIKYV